jgi:hypothetical protein
LAIAALILASVLGRWERKPIFKGVEKISSGPASESALLQSNRATQIDRAINFFPFTLAGVQMEM